MSDKPEDPNPPELPEAWKKPPDANWKPSGRPAEPEGNRKAILSVLGMVGAVFVGIPVLAVLLFLGTCFLGGRF